MRKFLLTAAALAAVTVSFATPSLADDCYDGYTQSYTSQSYGHDNDNSYKNDSYTSYKSDSYRNDGYGYSHATYQSHDNYGYSNSY